MNDYPLTLFHDGNCPICRLDIDTLKSRNAAARLRFVDIAAPDFNPALYGKTLAAFQAEIHAQLPNGKFVTGMEVFRRAYSAVGLGWVVAPASWRVLRRPADALYRWFARHRPALSHHFGFIFEAALARRAASRAKSCRTGQCPVSSGH